MADNVTLPGTGAAIAADDVGGVLFQRVKPAIGADGTAVDVSAGAGVVGTGVQRITLASDDPAVVALQIMDDWDETNRAAVNLIPGQAGIAAGAGAVAATVPRVTLASDDPNVAAVTDTTRTSSPTYTRPADAAPYAAGDALANSTSAPTAGGLTFTVVRASGKGGVVTDLIVTSANAPGTPLQGELWLFDTAPTAVNDNAAFTVSDSEVLTLVGIIPFALTTVGANSGAHVQGLNIGFTTVGAATLRGLVRVTNAYTPASGEVVAFRLKTTPIG